ncbi:MAG: DEAD/DEAH box helicase, partial [Geminicoccaceae bacterium]|nr:DEAD/DEAH box helicase [Geminicoccaceae bacterium]
VLIATPGRLLDQFERGRVLLSGISILVIDEADRMLDMGFIPDVERIVRLLTKREQTMMFSATMPGEVRRLASTFLVEPEEVQAAPPATTAERVADHLTVVPPRQKFKALRQLIDAEDVGKAIIFCNRKREVASLRRQLERAGLNVRDIHGDLDQSQRTQALDAFKRGEIDYLVATDVAARGLDIAMLPCVINYDVPTHPDDYVHRIGRTGRAGQEGRAFTLVLPEEGHLVSAITRLTGRAIPRLQLRGFDDEDLVETPKGRRRRGGKPTRIEDPGPTASEAEASPLPDLPDEESAAGRAGQRSRRRRGRSKSEVERREPAVPETAPPAAADQGKTEPVAAEPAAIEPEAARERSDGRRGRGSAEQRGERAPVVGMGDHVPSFMLRPVPAALLARKTGSE